MRQSFVIYVYVHGLFQSLSFSRFWLFFVKSNSITLRQKRLHYVTSKITACMRHGTWLICERWRQRRFCLDLGSVLLRQNWFMQSYLPAIDKGTRSGIQRVRGLTAVPWGDSHAVFVVLSHRHIIVLIKYSNGVFLWWFRRGCNKTPNNGNDWCVALW